MKLLQIHLVNFYPLENATLHRTDKFELVHGRHLADNDAKQEVVILRRGQPFTAVISFVGRNYDHNVDQIEFKFSLGDNPDRLKGTQGVFSLHDNTNDHPSHKWDVKHTGNKDDCITLEMTAPSEAPIGSWIISVQTKTEGVSGSGHYDYVGDFYLLFNPWNKDDSVYMDDMRLLDEYVLNDVGKIWNGTPDDIKGRHWVYGQFDAVILPACIMLLDRARVPFESRCDPITLTRAISKIVNSNDDQGVVVGSWEGNYDGGVAPAAWTGSVEILRQFYETQKEVRYGQCWVFAGIVTTVCRALGIPTRTVTNFGSAHDTNSTLTVDFYYDNEMDELGEEPTNNKGRDSIWNYHVWNDVWMERSDLPTEFGGWQAIDATPQERSGDFYQCGPAPLSAIKRGLIGLRYDIQFMLASVNADVMSWMVNPKSKTGYTKVRCNRRRVGIMLLTKKPFVFDPRGSEDMENITDNYKFREGSMDERMSLVNGAKASERARRYLSLADRDAVKVKEEIELTLVPLMNVEIGESFKVTVNIKNRCNKTRTAKVVLRAISVYYNGKSGRLVRRYKCHVTLQPYSSQQVDIKVVAEDYLHKLVEYGNMKIAGVCFVQETDNIWADDYIFLIRRPRIEITVNPPVIVGQRATAWLSFRNPLNWSLTNCQFNAEGPQLFYRRVQVPHPDVGPGEMLQAQVELLPKISGEFELGVTFYCSQMVDITGSEKIVVFNN